MYDRRSKGTQHRRPAYDAARAVPEAYDRDPGREWDRLARDPYHTLEFAVTMHVLRKHLPPHGTVLDAGAGPGRYSIALARDGYQVTLLDISPANVELAQERVAEEPEQVRGSIASCLVGDIRDLSLWEDRTFDAVLCLGGPLSHLPEREDRVQAVSELTRVARRGAVVALAGIGYLALLREIMVQASESLVDQEILELLAQGKDYCAGMLWHFFRAEELRELAESCGLMTLEMAGCEGLSTGLVQATNGLYQEPAKWKQWMAWVLATASEPAVVDMAEHILYVGRKT